MSYARADNENYRLRFAARPGVRAGPAGAYAGIRFTIMPRNAWESKLTAGSIITANVLQLDYSPVQAVRLGRRHNMPPPQLDF